VTTYNVFRIEVHVLRNCTLTQVDDRNPEEEQEEGGNVVGDEERKETRVRICKFGARAKAITQEVK
jgi:hypothetical protein